MFLLIDNYDSFVYNIRMYLRDLDEEIEVFRRDSISLSDIKRMNPTGIILSPGPKSPLETKECIDIIHTFKGTIPILGICLGHQCIAYAFGAKIVKLKMPTHGKVHSIKTDGKGIFENIPAVFKVTRYHSLVVDTESIGEELEISALSDDGVIMGIRHKKYHIEGVQFHPEAVLTEFGHELLHNFIQRAYEFQNKRM